MRQVLPLRVVGSTIRFWFICEPGKRGESCVFPNSDLEVLAKIGRSLVCSLTELVILIIENRARYRDKWGVFCYERFYHFTS